MSVPSNRAAPLSGSFTGANPVINLPTTAQADDIIVVVLLGAGGGSSAFSPAAPTGYASPKSGVYWKKAVGGETSVSFSTSGTSFSWAYSSFVLVDAADVILATSSGAWGPSTGLAATMSGFTYNQWFAVSWGDFTSTAPYSWTSQPSQTAALMSAQLPVGAGGLYRTVGIGYNFGNGSTGTSFSFFGNYPTTESGANVIVVVRGRSAYSFAFNSADIDYAVFSATVEPYRAKFDSLDTDVVTFKGTVTPFGINVSYVATMGSGGAGPSATVAPGGGTPKRSTLRFPLFGEYPPLARVTKVELRGSVTGAGGAAGSWQVRPYASFDDPEQDTFTDQYTKAGSATTVYATVTTPWRGTGVFQVNLGAQAVTDVQALLKPRYGYVPLGIVETTGATAVTLDNLALIITYEVPAMSGKELHRLSTVTLLRPGVPPVVAEPDLAEYAAHFVTAWQGPGSFTMSLPIGSPAAAKAEDMGLVHLAIGGYPIITGLIEDINTTRTVNQGKRSLIVNYAGASIHRFIANRTTGPWPGGFNHASQLAFIAAGDVAESYTAGDVSPRGSAYGAASASAESILRKLLRTHTVDADSARRTAWTNNLSFGPDDRRGVSLPGMESRFQPLLGEAGKLCSRGDCGYAVVLDELGRFRWFFLPGIDRTSDRGHWFISTDLSKGVEDVEASRSSTELVTHLYVAANGERATRNMLLVPGDTALADTYDRREAFIDASNVTTEAAAELQASAYLAEHSYQRRIVVGLSGLLEAGWLTAFNVGDKLMVTDSVTGLSDIVRVYQVEVTLGTEEMVRAMLDRPGVDPAITLELERQADRRDDNSNFVAIGSLVTSPNPFPGVPTFKETSQTALR